MMKQSKRDIVEGLAKARVVERLVQNITARSLDATTRDLVQVVYLYLLEMREEHIQDLHASGELVYFMVRIIMNQWAGSRSTFRKLLRDFSARSLPLDPVWNDKNAKP